MESGKPFQTKSLDNLVLLRTLPLTISRIHLAPVRHLGLAVWLLSAVLSYGGLKLPADCKISGQAESGSGEVQVSAGEKANSVQLEGPMSAKAPGFILKGKTGKPETLNLTFRNEQNQALSLNFAARDLTVQSVVFPDAFIALGWPGRWGKYFVRPNIGFYKPEEIAKRKDAWLKLPGASEHSFTLELRPVSHTEFAAWLDGQLVNVLPFAGPLASYRVTLRPGASVESIRLEAFVIAIRRGPRHTSRKLGRLMIRLIIIRRRPKPTGKKFPTFMILEKRTELRKVSPKSRLVWQKEIWI